MPQGLYGPPNGIIELSLISATVSFLSQRAKGMFDVVSGDFTFAISGEPANLIVDQGHTSNGASGTAFIIIGCCGFLALWLRDRPGYHAKSSAGLFSRVWYKLWLGLNVPALLLTLGALAFTFNVCRGESPQWADDQSLSGGGAERRGLSVGDLDAAGLV